MDRLRAAFARADDLGLPIVVADALREVGLDRVVYGTDWDAIPLALNLDEIREALPMTDEEIRDLLDDPAPYLEP